MKVVPTIQKVFSFLGIIIFFLSTTNQQCLDKEFLEKTLVLSPLETPINMETTYCPKIFSTHGACVNDYSFNLLIDNIIEGFIGKI